MSNKQKFPDFIKTYCEIVPNNNPSAIVTTTYEELHKYYTSFTKPKPAIQVKTIKTYLNNFLSNNITINLKHVELLKDSVTNLRVNAAGVQRFEAMMVLNEVSKPFTSLHTLEVSPVVESAVTKKRKSESFEIDENYQQQLAQKRAIHEREKENLALSFLDPEMVLTTSSSSSSIYLPFLSSPMVLSSLPVPLSFNPETETPKMLKENENGSEEREEREIEKREIEEDETELEEKEEENEEVEKNNVGEEVKENKSDNNIILQEIETICNSKELASSSSSSSSSSVFLSSSFESFDAVNSQMFGISGRQTTSPDVGRQLFEEFQQNQKKTLESQNKLLEYLLSRVYQLEQNQIN